MSQKKSKPVKRRTVKDPLVSDAPLSEVMARLALALPQVSPSEGAKAQLLARIQAGKTAVPSTIGWRFDALDSAAGWVRLPFPGVRMREVTVDRDRDTALVYIEIAAGAVFPDHEHAAKERGLVLSGDLKMGAKRLRAGDFYEAEAGTRHERISSSAGCTGLLWVGAQAWQKWRAAIAENSKT